MAKKQKSNVVSLVNNEPNLILVGILQDLLERAKKGEIYGMAYVTENQGGQFVGTNYEGSNTMLMVGALEHLKVRLLAMIRAAQDSAC